MSEVLLVSVIISAKDMASQIFAKLGVAAKSTYGVMAMAAAGVAGGLIAIGAAANHYASEFQTQFARISGLTGSSSEQLKYYQDNLIQLSAQYDLTSADAAKALYFIISAGLDPLGSAMQRAKENMDVLRYSSMSATASLADQATVADAMTSMMKAFADSNITAADAANTLTRIEVYGKATLSAFASSLGFTMTTAKAAGVTMHETAAAVATLSQVSGQHGIRRMQMELSNLMRSLLDVNAIAKRAKAQGLNFDEAAFSTMTFIGKLQYLQHLTGALSSNINDQTYAQMVNMDATKNQLQATAALDKQLDISNSNFMKLTGGAAAFIPATILLEQHASNYTQILAEMNKKQDIVKAAFDNMRNTANQQWKMAEIGLQNLLVVIGLQLLPVLQGVYHAIYLVTNGLIAWLQNTGNMTAFKYALLGIAIVVGTILTPAIVGLALAFVTNPIFLSIMAIVGAGILLGKVLQAHPAIIKRVEQALAGMASGAGHVVSAIMGVVRWVKNNEVAFTALKAVLIAVAILMLNMAVNAVASMIAGFIEMTPYLLLQIAMWYGMAAAVIAATWPFVLAGLAIAALVFGIMELVQHWTQVKAFFGNIGKAIGGFFSSLGTVVHDGLGHVGQFFQAAFDKIGQIIDWFTTLTPQKIFYMVGYALGFLMMLPVRATFIIGNLVEALLHLIGTLVAQIPALLWRMATLVFSLLLQLSNTAGRIVQAGVQIIITAFSWLVTQGPQQFAKMIWFILDSLGHFKDQVWTAIKNVTAVIWAELQKLPDQAAHLIWDFENGLVNAIKTGASWVWDAIKHLASGMVDAFKNALGIHSPSAVMFAHGVNIVQGLINGFRSIDVGTAWLQHVAGLSQPITPALAGAGSGGAAGQPFRGLHLPQGGGVHAPVYNITVNAPTSNAPELVKAMRQEMDRRERENYHRARRSGYGGGLHAGIGGTEVD